jgi:flagellar biosynthesis/type III secretory pathway chaperone
MKKMDIAKLAELLDRLCHLYDRLKEIESEKTKVLLSGDVNELSSLMNLEQAVMMECRNTEEERLKLCDGGGYKTLKELMESSEDRKMVIWPFYIKLSETIKELKKINALNMRLLDSRLSTIRFLLNKIGLSVSEGECRKTVRAKA